MGSSCLTRELRGRQNGKVGPQLEPTCWSTLLCPPAFHKNKHCKLLCSALLFPHWSHQKHNSSLAGSEQRVISYGMWAPGSTSPSTPIPPNRALLLPSEGAQSPHPEERRTEEGAGQRPAGLCSPKQMIFISCTRNEKGGTRLDRNLTHKELKCNADAVHNDPRGTAQLRNASRIRKKHTVFRTIIWERHLLQLINLK